MPPSVLYKYVSPEAAIAVLRDTTLKWSSPKAFNDPLELQRFPVFEPDLIEALRPYMATLARTAAGEELIDEARLTERSKQVLESFRMVIARGASADDIIRRLPPDLDVGAAEVRQRLLDFFDLDHARILCLTEIPTNTAMWEHYTMRSTGCVLGFRALEDSPWLEARKVSYLDTLPSLGSGIDMHLYGHTPAILKTTVDTVCYSKSSDWEYEREWRMVTWRRNEEGLFGFYPFISAELESVTFGIRTTPETEVEIRALVHPKYRDCSFYRIKITDGVVARVPANM